MELYQLYRPLTATPFRRGEEYAEFEPCDALKPYIRCFWGSLGPVAHERGEDTASLVIPDTCMDIIFTANFTNNRMECRFCGIDDRAFTSRGDGIRKTIFQFAIRFYPWSAFLFAEESLSGTKNAFLDASRHFPDIVRALKPLLFDFADIRPLLAAAETALLRRLSVRRKNPAFFLAMSGLLKNRGNVGMAELKREAFVSSRQLERLFQEYVGTTPKSLASMVRYQCLWQELLSSRTFHAADAACRYGYSDQAHLCHDFRKYHSMNMSEARSHALKMSEKYKTGASPLL